MSKLVFEDKSFVEIIKSDNPGKVIISISARDGSDKLKKINNAVEITVEEFKELIRDMV
jgi:hypothetical protein